MNFTRKLKTLGVAILAATASQMSFASLLHANPNTGNGSFFFIASNDEGDSYIQSLANANGAFRLDSAIPVTEQDFTLGSALSNVLLGTNPMWSVLAADSASVPGQGTYPGLRLNVTTSTDTSSFGGPTTIRNAALLQGLQFINAYLANVETNLVTTAGVGLYDPGAEGDSTDVGNFFVAGPGGSLNGRAPTEAAMLEVGAKLDAWLLESFTNVTNTALIPITFGTAVQQGQWTFNGATLHYGAATSAVPVPAAVWLLGSALVGVTGVRRRKA